ncbi:MAG: SAM-dependent methyltransferase [Planctomycetota bacterium]
MSELDAIWELFAELRADRNMWAHGMAPTAPAQGPSAGLPSETIRLLREAFANGDKTGAWPHPEYKSPRALVEFSARFAKRAQPDSILDPVCGYGMLLAGSADAAGAGTVHGVDINAEAVAIASTILGQPSAVIHGDCFSSPDELLDRYDLIVADPPLGARLSTAQSATMGLKAKSLGLDQGLVAWAASRLAEGGVALLVVAPSFFFNKQSAKVREALEKVGCRIGAAIYLPREERRDAPTSIGSYLLVVERGEQGDIFVGQLNREPEHQDQLLANLLLRKPTGIPSLGRLCSLSAFRGYESLVALENLSRLARDLGWSVHAAEAVFPHYERMREDRGGTPSEDADSLYLKVVGKGRASTQLDELRTGKSQKLREILHLKLDPAVADPAFMVHWFNETRVGRLTLSALASGGYIPRISPKDLLRSRIFLPSLGEQSLVVEGAAYLGRVRAEVAELEGALWSGSDPVEDLVERIRSINQDDRYEDWLETLPFPLASILWRHHASNGAYRHRYEVLLHFFEATAAFLATIHLSAFMSDDETWNDHGRGLQEKLSGQNLSLDRASFGAWKLVYEYLSAECSRVISEKGPEGEEPRWQRLFCTTDLRFVEMLSDSRLRRILQDANKVRNDWQGHSGAIGEDTAKGIHQQLEDLVQQVREVFGRAWQGCELIQPDIGRYSQGVHYVTSRRLMGTRSAPFEERVYDSEHPLEAGSLYLFDTVSQQGLKLLSFIEVIPSPEQRAVACFIFSRLEKDSARWVSYHFEQESEIHHYSEDVNETLRKLNQFEERDLSI